MADLQRAFEGAPAYTHLMTGVPPGQADAQGQYSFLPEGKSYDEKFVFGVYRDSDMVGCADLIRAYPEQDAACLGLLLISEAFQRQGIGTAAYRRIEEFIRAWGTCTRVWLGVVRTNEGVLSFWFKLGFTPTGETKPYRYGAVASETITLSKRLAQ